MDEGTAVSGGTSTDGAHALTQRQFRAPGRGRKTRDSTSNASLDQRALSLMSDLVGNATVV
jgi:hypothetical protein